MIHISVEGCGDGTLISPSSKVELMSFPGSLQPHLHKCYSSFRICLAGFLTPVGKPLPIFLVSNNSKCPYSLPSTRFGRALVPSWFPRKCVCARGTLGDFRPMR